MTRDRIALLVVAAHLAVALAHGAAHAVLGVSAGGWEGVGLIVAAVYVGPVVSLALLRRGLRRIAGYVLSASMAAALIYGGAFHFVLLTPDHVAHTPPGAWGGTFRLSAVSIAILEACGLAAGVALLTGREAHRTGPGPRADRPEPSRHVSPGT